ncbi:MAG: pilus assembly protein [Sphingomonadales bacterium]|nr:pilus assembly protein [Sphingomonadales bacterium]
MIANHIKRLRQDRDGVSVVEFALLAPVLLTMLMGLLDLAYNMYTAQMLQGAIQNAARQSTLEGASGREAAIDASVTSAVRAIAPNSTLTFNRESYSSFSEAGRPEDYVDQNANGTCDNGELYEDANGNGAWDTDTGTTGFGGARDAVVYSVSVTYERPFPVFALIPGQTSTYTLNTSTILRNQPFGAQEQRPAPTTGNCT